MGKVKDDGWNKQCSIHVMQTSELKIWLEQSVARTVLVDGEWWFRASIVSDGRDWREPTWGRPPHFWQEFIPERLIKAKTLRAAKAAVLLFIELKLQSGINSLHEPTIRKVSHAKKPQ